MVFIGYIVLFRKVSGSMRIIIIIWKFFMFFIFKVRLMLKFEKVIESRKLILRVGRNLFSLRFFVSG